MNCKTLGKIVHWYQETLEVSISLTSVFVLILNQFYMENIVLLYITLNFITVIVLDE